jgi:hypothetical protein
MFHSKNLIIKTKVSTLAQNIQRSNLEENIIANARFGKTCRSIIILTMSNNISSVKKMEKI